MSSIDSKISALPSARSFTLQYQKAKGRGALGCWLALPVQISAEAPPLIAIHGIQRGAEDQARFFGERAAAMGRPVIAPLFDERRWPRYQQVVRNKRADLALLALMTELRLTGVWKTRKFDLAGYSGGAQFAHRFTMLYPQLVSRLTVASAGWYTFPDAAIYPYGLSPRPGRSDDWGPRLAAGLDQFLRIPVQVCVGADDNTPDANTRSGLEIDRQQGKDRVTRGIRWTESLRQAAEARGLLPSVDFNLLPDSGHEFRACITRGGLDRFVLPQNQSAPATACETAGREAMVQRAG